MVKHLDVPKVVAVSIPGAECLPWKKYTKNMWTYLAAYDAFYQECVHVGRNKFRVGHLLLYNDRKSGKPIVVRVVKVISIWLRVQSVGADGSEVRWVVFNDEGLKPLPCLEEDGTYRSATEPTGFTRKNFVGWMRKFFLKYEEDVAPKEIFYKIDPRMRPTAWKVSVGQRCLTFDEEGFAGVLCPVKIVGINRKTDIIEVQYDGCSYRHRLRLPYFRTRALFSYTMAAHMGLHIGLPNKYTGPTDAFQPQLTLTKMLPNRARISRHPPPNFIFQTGRLSRRENDPELDEYAEYAEIAVMNAVVLSEDARKASSASIRPTDVKDPHSVPIPPEDIVEPLLTLPQPGFTEVRREPDVVRSEEEHLLETFQEAEDTEMPEDTQNQSEEGQDRHEPSGDDTSVALRPLVAGDIVAADDPRVLALMARSMDPLLKRWTDAPETLKREIAAEARLETINITLKTAPTIRRLVTVLPIFAPGAIERRLRALTRPGVERLSNVRRPARPSVQDVPARAPTPPRRRPRENRRERNLVEHEHASGLSDRVLGYLLEASEAAAAGHQRAARRTRTTRGRRARTTERASNPPLEEDSINLDAAEAGVAAAPLQSVLPTEETPSNMTEDPMPAALPLEPTAIKVEVDSDDDDQVLEKVEQDADLSQQQGEAPAESPSEPCRPIAAADPAPLAQPTVPAASVPVPRSTVSLTSSITMPVSYRRPADYLFATWDLHVEHYRKQKEEENKRKLEQEKDADGHDANNRKHEDNEGGEESLAVSSSQAEKTPAVLANGTPGGAKKRGANSDKSVLRREPAIKKAVRNDPKVEKVKHPNSLFLTDNDGILFRMGKRTMKIEDTELLPLPVDSTDYEDVKNVVGDMAEEASSSPPEASTARTPQNSPSMEEMSQLSVETEMLLAAGPSSSRDPVRFPNLTGMSPRPKRKQTSSQQPPAKKQRREVPKAAKKSSSVVAARPQPNGAKVKQEADPEPEETIQQDAATIYRPTPITFGLTSGSIDNFVLNVRTSCQLGAYLDRSAVETIMEKQYRGQDYCEVFQKVFQDLIQCVPDKALPGFLQALGAFNADGTATRPAFPITVHSPRGRQVKWVPLQGSVFKAYLWLKTFLCRLNICEQFIWFSKPAACGDCGAKSRRKPTEWTLTQARKAQLRILMKDRTTNPNREAVKKHFHGNSRTIDIIEEHDLDFVELCQLTEEIVDAFIDNVSTLDSFTYLTVCFKMRKEAWARVPEEKRKQIPYM